MKKQYEAPVAEELVLLSESVMSASGEEDDTVPEWTTPIK